VIALQRLCSRAKCGLGFGLAGFIVAVVLCAYTFYLTSHQRVGNELVFLVLCPPSIGALALDNAGVIKGLVGWLWIAVANSALYAAAGFGCGVIWENFVERMLHFRAPKLKHSNAPGSGQVWKLVARLSRWQEIIIY